jgi:hypothetical protein
VDIKQTEVPQSYAHCKMPMFTSLWLINMPQHNLAQLTLSPQTLSGKELHGEVSSHNIVHHGGTRTLLPEIHSAPDLHNG